MHRMMRKKTLHDSSRPERARTFWNILKPKPKANQVNRLQQIVCPTIMSITNHTITNITNTKPIYFVPYGRCPLNHPYGFFLTDLYGLISTFRIKSLHR